MATGQSINPKRVHYHRLQTLLVDGGTEVIKHVFNSRTNVPLTVHLSNCHNKILQLKTDRIISKKQYDSLFTATGQPIGNGVLDITLLTCLLQHTCGLQPSTPKSIWFSTPQPNDTSLEADIVRMRQFRNELAHRHDIALSQQKFITEWTNIETVLLRLDSACKPSIPNLKTTLDEIKTRAIDEETQERCDQILKDWEEMDKTVLSELAYNTHTTKAVMKCVSEIQENLVTPRLKGIKATSEKYFEEMQRNQDVFVKTQTYQAATERLKTSGIVILSGYAGEGKTTMGSQMLLETCPLDKILKLSLPKDWEQLFVKDWNGIFIDDIFGSESLDKEKVKDWEPYLQELGAEASELNIFVVITTRQNILKEAMDHINLKHFKDENICFLSSSELSKEEKREIVSRHLFKNGRELPQRVLIACVSRWKDDAYKVGFPECAAMFAQNDAMFDKGPNFFAEPYDFFYKCLFDLSKNEDEFMVLVLIWTKSSKTLSKFDLEQEHLSSLTDVAKELNYPLLERPKKLRKALEHYKGGFLILTERSDEYTFSHSVIGDVVGLVVGEEYPGIAIKYGSNSFLLKFVKTSCGEGNDRIIVDDRRFSVLSKRFNQLIFEKKDRSDELHKALKEMRYMGEGLENTRISQSLPDLSILEHEAFNNGTFVKEYINPANGNKIVFPSVLEVFEHFRNPYSIVFEYEDMGMCLPSFFLAKRNGIMVYECIKQNILTEKEKFIALLIATRDDNELMVQTLIEAGAGVNEDVLQIATVNENIAMLEILVRHFPRLNSNISHIIKGNFPLITAAKRGLVDAVTCLLSADIDINQTNENGLSALDKAVIGNHVAICEVLVNKGCKLDVKSGKFQRTPLHKAVDMGYTDIVELLLNVGASVDTTDHHGDLPIRSAAFRRHTDILRLLLIEDKALAAKPFNFNGSTVHFPNITLFHYAVWKEDVNLIKLLKEFEIDPNIRDSYGRTPIYLATFYNKPEFVELLIDIADVNLPEHHGYTPLHAAAFKVNPELVELLSMYNADIRMVDRKGNTVFHALKCGLEKVNGCTANKGNDLLSKMCKCAEVLFEKDAEFEHMLGELKNKKGIIVTVKRSGDMIYFT